MVANEGLEKAENTPTHFGGRVEWTPRRESKHPVEWWAMPAVIRIGTCTSYSVMHVGYMLVLAGIYVSNVHIVHESLQCH